MYMYVPVINLRHTISKKVVLHKVFFVFHMIMVLCFKCVYIRIPASCNLETFFVVDEWCRTLNQRVVGSIPGESTAW
jgi:hypothetical protein